MSLLSSCWTGARLSCSIPMTPTVRIEARSTRASSYRDIACRPLAWEIAYCSASATSWTSEAAAGAREPSFVAETRTDRHRHSHMNWGSLRAVRNWRNPGTSLTARVLLPLRRARYAPIVEQLGRRALDRHCEAMEVAGSAWPEGDLGSAGSTVGREALWRRRAVHCAGCRRAEDEQFSGDGKHHLRG